MPGRKSGPEMISEPPRQKDVKKRNGDKKSNRAAVHPAVLLSIQKKPQACGLGLNDAGLKSRDALASSHPPAWIAPQAGK